MFNAVQFNTTQYDSLFKLHVIITYIPPSLAIPMMIADLSRAMLATNPSTTMLPSADTSVILPVRPQDSELPTNSETSILR